MHQNTKYKNTKTKIQTFQYFRLTAGCCPPASGVTLKMHQSSSTFRKFPGGTVQGRGNIQLKSWNVKFSIQSSVLFSQQKKSTHLWFCLLWFILLQHQLLPITCDLRPITPYLHSLPSLFLNIQPARCWPIKSLHFWNQSLIGWNTDKYFNWIWLEMKWNEVVMHQNSQRVHSCAEETELKFHCK